MQNGKNFHTLIKNIGKAVKSHGPDELNMVIVDMMNSNNNKQDNRVDVEYLLTIISNGYGISKRTLKTARATDNLSQAKNVAYCILHYRLKLPVRHIGSTIFSLKSHTCVWRAVNKFNTLNEKVKEDRLFKEKYDLFDAQFVEYITKKNDIKE